MASPLPVMPTELHKLIFASNWPMVKKRAKSHPNEIIIKTKDTGNTAFILAIGFMADLETLKIIYDSHMSSTTENHAAPVDILRAADTWGQFPLHYAAMLCDGLTLGWLIGLDAAPLLIKDKAGKFPYEAATLHKQSAEVVGYLMKETKALRNKR